MFPAARAEASAQPASFSNDPEAVEKAAKSVLLLEVYDGSDRLIGTGSGFVAFDNKTLVTNYHVMADAAWIMAVSDGGDRYLVTKFIAGDQDIDIALLEFLSPTDLAPLPLYAGDTLRRSAPVVAIGYPLGLTNTVSMGNISAFYYDGGFRTIQFTAPISHGSSGGALFNDDGEVIGITEGGYEEGQNLNLAVDIGEVRRMMEAGAGNKRISFAAQQKMEWLPQTPTPSPRPTPTLAPTPTPVPTPTPEPTLEPWLYDAFDLKALRTLDGVLLRWEAFPGALRYDILRKTQGETGLSSVATVKAEDTLFLDRDAASTDADCVYIAVALMDEAGSVWRASVSATTWTAVKVQASVPSPGLLRVAEGADRPAIVWQAVDGAMGYEVFRGGGTAGPFYVTGHTVDTFFCDWGAGPGVGYYYRIRTVTDGAVSEMSAPVWMQSPQAPVPSPVPGEPDATLRITGDGTVLTYSGYAYLSPYLYNMSAARTVAEFELAFYCLDAQEVLVRQTGTDAVCYIKRYDRAFGPGQGGFPPTAWLYGFENVKYVYVIINSVTYMDGETVTVPVQEQDLHIWTLE